MYTIDQLSEEARKQALNTMCSEHMFMDLTEFEYLAKEFNWTFTEDGEFVETEDVQLV